MYCLEPSERVLSDSSTPPSVAEAPLEPAIKLYEPALGINTELVWDAITNGLSEVAIEFTTTSNNIGSFSNALLKSASDKLIDPSLIVLTPSSDKYRPFVSYPGNSAVIIERKFLWIEFTVRSLASTPYLLHLYPSE